MTVAGVPLRVSPTFIAVAILSGWSAGRDVVQTRLSPVRSPPKDWRAIEAWLQTFDARVTQPSLGWALAAGAGVALVYFLSVLLHELGHLAAAQTVGIEVTAIQLDFAGGFVEWADDARLTAGRYALIVGAGPLATAALALASLATMRAVDFAAQTSASITAERILSAALIINAVVLAINLLPFRPLDGGQLLAAARLRMARG